MNRLHAVKFATAITWTFLLLYTLCAVAVALFPEGTVSFFNAWFHGLDLNLLRPTGGKTMTYGQFVVGALGVVVVAFPGGFLLAAIYDVLLGRPETTAVRAP